MPAALQLPPALAQAAPVAALDRALARDRLGHALLLHGPDLATLDTVARAIAQHLLEARGDALSHPDCFTLRPTGKARAIKVGTRDSEEPNTMRQLLRDLQKTPQAGVRKTAILYEVDRMNAATANAFLKTLEEPPASTHLFLLTTKPWDLLPTIRSRCLVLRLPGALEPVDEAEWAAWQQAFRAWVDDLFTLGRDRRRWAEATLTIYGLVARYSHVLEAMGKAAWKAERDTLPDTLTDEEVVALETGLVKGMRARLWIDVQETFHRHLRHEIQARPALAHWLPARIRELEQLAPLVDKTNLADTAALEVWLLGLLRQAPALSED